VLHLDLFSGIGGFAYAADRVFGEVEHIFCDNDRFCQQVLKKHWKDSYIYDDIRAITADSHISRYLYGKSEKQSAERPHQTQRESKPGVRALTSSPAASPASRSLQLALDVERPMTVTSGRKCLELYDLQNPNGSSLRTCVAYLLGTKDWYSSKSVLTWKPKVTKSNRLLFQLSPSTLRTGETESGSLPTPDTSDRRSKNSKQQGTSNIVGARTGLKLQPNFVEWMMGFPQNWTDLNYPSPNIAKKGSKV
jgi:hypothetical protein